MLKQLQSKLTDQQKANLYLKAVGLTKIPLLFATGAKVVSIDEEHCCIRMPFLRIIKNHLGSVYFGALAIGADACVGFLAAHKIQNSKEKISLVFKSFHADFLKRAEGPTEFICSEGEQIDELIAEVIATGQRAHRKLSCKAVCNGETVAEFTLELSLKKKY